jgi:hypothetical protein
MSFIFEIDGETVWSPALRVGQVFVGCAQVLGESTNVLPGFSFNGEDMINIDRGQLLEFAEALAAISERPGSFRVLTGLAEAVRVPCLVMLERVGEETNLDGRPGVSELMSEARASIPC